MQAPGRVNLIGEHIDYCGGHVLPVALGLRCAAAVAAGAGMLRVHAVDLGDAWECAAGVEPRSMPRPAPGTWRSYAAGVVSLIAEAAGGPIPAADIFVASDVPRGSGLSSSAAFEVSLAGAVLAAMGGAIAPSRVAALCRRAEHEFAGVPCGIMDQAVAALGRTGHAMLLDCVAFEAGAAAGHTDGVRHVPLPGAREATLLIVDTGVRHALAGGEYARRRAACESAARKLGVTALCRAPLDAIARARLTDEETRCATHAIGEDRRTLEAAAALGAGELSRLGVLMIESHESLRDVYRVSCPELDSVVDAARGVPGVFGARMTGGGFGGCAIVLARAGAAEAAIGVVIAAFRTRFSRDCAVLAGW